MSDAIKTIHTLLVTLSAAELCEVITRSAELCAGLAKKKPSVVRVAPIAPVAPVASVAPVTAPKPSKPSVARSAPVPPAAPVAKPSVKPVAKEEPVEPVAKEEPNIPKTFAALLGWSDSEEDGLLQHSHRAYDSSDEFREDSESNEDSVDAEPAEPTLSPVKKCRDMTKCFTHGQRIRHTVSDKVRMGTYDSAKNAIIHNGIVYSTLTKFATAHVLAEYNPNRATTRDGWKHCKCEVKGKWISTYNLP